MNRLDLHLTRVFCFFHNILRPSQISGINGNKILSHFSRPPPAALFYCSFVSDVRTLWNKTETKYWNSSRLVSASFAYFCTKIC